MKIREYWEDEKKGEDEKKEENDEPVPVLTNFSFVGMICGGKKKKNGRNSRDCFAFDFE